MSNYISKGELTYENASAIAFALLKWGSHVKDLYTLARMIYYVDKTDNILSYDGVLHSETYADFFKNYMKAKVIYKENHVAKNTLYNLFKENNKQQLRCVHLPLSTVKDVFNVV